ncbi:MAG: hypothetical protein ACR2IJ_02405 [Fluviibacter sp.]
MNDGVILAMIVQAALSLGAMLYSQRAARNSQDMQELLRDVVELKTIVKMHMDNHP